MKNATGTNPMLSIPSDIPQTAAVTLRLYVDRLCFVNGKLPLIVCATLPGVGDAVVAAARLPSVATLMFFGASRAMLDQTLQEAVAAVDY
jgi:hypothetical protein